MILSCVSGLHCLDLIVLLDVDNHSRRRARQPQSRREREQRGGALGGSFCLENVSNLSCGCFMEQWVGERTRKCFKRLTSNLKCINVRAFAGQLKLCFKVCLLLLPSLICLYCFCVVAKSSELSTFFFSNFEDCYSTFF